MDCLSKATALAWVKLGLRIIWSWRYTLAAVIVIALIAEYFVMPAVLGPVVAVTSVKQGEFLQSVVASGHIEAPFRVNIGSLVTGVVADIPVDEGQTVRAGQTLIVLDAAEAKASLAQAEGAVAQAEARMRQIVEFTLPTAEELLRQAQATLLNAEQTYDRTAKLAKDGIATKATLDDATRARDIAKAQVRSAELQVYTNRAGGSDYVMAQTQLNQARASQATAQSRLNYTTITAPRDGVLISRNVERGYVVQPSMILMVLSPSVQTELVVQVDEKNLGLIAIGQDAIVSADAFPKLPFKAFVSYINPGIDLQKASVEVKLRVPDPPTFLRQDMTVSVDIATARHPNAILVPVASVRSLSTDSPWVRKVTSRHALRQPVTIGLVGGGMVEIVTGLTAGDMVVSTDTVLPEGGRVRARAAAEAKASTLQMAQPRP